MSSCSSADSASAMSLSGHSLQHRAQGGDVVHPPDEDVGQHVEPADQIELLEDHGAAGAPVGERRAAQPRHLDVAEADDAARSGFRAG